MKYHIGTKDDVLAIDARIPEFDGRTTASKLAARLDDKRHLILVASDNKQPIAYKLGYEVSGSEFYSWLGGVVPAYRKQGVATELRKRQEAWAIEKGYCAISVKSMNQYPAMLQLLISSGYQVSGYQDNGSVNNSKICFLKLLELKQEQG